MRDRALFNLTIDSKMRGCDLVKVMIGDVRNHSGIQTGPSAWLEPRRHTISDFVFSCRINYLGHLSTRQNSRFGNERVSTVGLDSGSNCLAAVVARFSSVGSILI